ncbi:hypothetical protein [Pandoraea sp. SD6-2]|uniref:hypothetical protein n=1 Tax=Pandoraea sp. SD6-2 TaxID=1286093 RepID=UPI00032F9D08|nr:hypothetical protein [Pandoraea sp. SD6-2]EON14856.1 hypothetical protein C266_04567 [Pandoraea sp. SD6-2]
MRTIHFYRYQMPSEKRWHKTRHRMDEATAKEWFAQFKPGSTFELIDAGAIEIDDTKDWHPGPNSHGGARPAKC